MDNKRSCEVEGGNNGHVAGDEPDPKKVKQSGAPSGIVLFTGATDWEEVGRKAVVLARSKNTIWNPRRMGGLLDVQVEYVSSGPTSVHMFAISNIGEVYGWGRNEKGQLGLGHINDTKRPTLLKELCDHRIVNVATGRNHSLFLTDKGRILVAGDNKFGQTVGGAGVSVNTTPHMLPHEGPPVVRISCGADFSAFVDIAGSVWTWGHPEYGQLGHNSEGNYLEKSGKVLFHFVYEPTKIIMFIEKDPRTKQVVTVPAVHIKEISSGANHTVAIDERCRAFSWGFGGYGRLGHSETSNELVPRLIKFLDGPRRGIRQVVAGGQFNVALSEVPGTAYMWGQYTTAKEANMYPKPVTDLSGWGIRSIACSSKGWMVAADESVIGCAPSPCYGELGMGENKKSSAQPVEIKTLDKLHIIQCGMGMAHSLFIARNETEDDKKALEKYDILDQSDS